VLGEFGGAAVLDKETQLVWERDPGGPARTWWDAQSHCNNKVVGNRKGWRLPTVQELASPVDPNNPDGNPDLPPGHPFDNVEANIYWSATAGAEFAGTAWLVNLGNGDVYTFEMTGTLFTWCVRGGQGVDTQ
jgi:hypothetical protein